MEVSLAEYWDMLDRHDWYYPFSDDGRTYSAGKRDADRLIKLTMQSPEHAALYEAFEKHHYTGNPWKTEQTPKPKRPGEDKTKDAEETDLF